MHTLQLILIEADSAEDAFDKVESLLSESEPRWSDWHNASNAGSLDFAGRWSGNAFQTPEEEDEDRGYRENYLCYADNQELADYVVQRHLGWRKNAMSECLPEVMPDLEELIQNYDSRKGFDPARMEMSMNLWRMKKLLELLGDDWTYESSIYDLEVWSASLSEFHKRCAQRPEKQFLIPVDFHH